MSILPQFHQNDGSPNVVLCYSSEFPKESIETLVTTLSKRGAIVQRATPSSINENDNLPVNPISLADIILVFVLAGDESAAWMKYEVRLILQRCWEDPAVRVLVIAPAVRAIPSSLRYQRFTDYFNSESVRFESWAERGVPSRFLDVVLFPQDQATEIGTLSSLDFAEWKNRLVHLNTTESPVDPHDLETLRSVLQNDISTLSNVISRAQDVTATFTFDDANAVIQRALLSKELQDDVLFDSYYKMALQVQSLMPDDDTRRGSLDYSLGLLALTTFDYSRAVELFSNAVQIDELQLGTNHPVTIAALYNLALSCSAVGRMTDARDIYVRALDAARDTIGDFHPQTAAIAFNLAQIVSSLGDPAEAMRLLELAAEAYRRVRPDDSAELDNVLTELANLEL